MKYKVGDKVKVVEFKQLEKKFVTRREFSNGRTFTPSMQKFCGKVVTIKFVESSCYVIHEDGGNWFWDDNMFESFPTQKIVITTDGVETLARLYEGDKVVKKATAKCSPDDTFDFNVGAKLAFERLMNEAKKKEEPQKYFNGKAVCIETKPHWAYTVGKVYEFKGGTTVIDNGRRVYTNKPVKSIEEWNEFYVDYAKMLAIVE